MTAPQARELNGTCTDCPFLKVGKGHCHWICTGVEFHGESHRQLSHDMEGVRLVGWRSG